ncbi:MAG: SUMF1/EgtB/PvdO family nonheme iron enzyme [Planctomycetes bacterium]|nr:SUMF1/EgtB/PvdO family nonheme iron enzyme [Planctomycetota bacterium]
MKIRCSHVPFLAPAAALLLPAIAAWAQGPDEGTPKPNDGTTKRLPAPPLLVEVEAGYVVVGTKTEKLREYLDGKFGAKVKMDLASQNPGERVRVEGFQIGATEVTNRQYLEFVNASGYPPPLSWAGKQAEEARVQFEAEQDTLKKADAKYKPKDFDPVVWWRANWKALTWGIPQGEEDHPVIFVSLKDAQAFCDWAGLRLPSEAEWMRAARGETDQEYIQGETFVAAHSLNVETSGTKLRPVTWIAESRTQSGIFDMAGSVYEWTTSPYAELKGYKPLKSTETKGQAEEINPKFDANERVVKGGSYRVENPRFSTRVAHRVKAANSAVSPMVGFRLVRTPSLGYDRMSTVLARQVDTAMLDGNVNVARTIGEEAWHCVEVGGLKNLEGYAVIRRPEFLLFAPRAEVRETSASKLHGASQKEPITLGVLTTSAPLSEPVLPAGSYIVKYRGAGKLPDKKKSGKGAEKEPEKDADSGGGDKKSKMYVPQDPAEKQDPPAEPAKPTKPEKKKPLSKKEQEKLAQEEAEKKKAEAEAAKVAEDAKKKAEAEKAANVAAGNAPSLEAKQDQEEIKLAEDIAWDPMKENLFFYDVASGAIVGKIESSSTPMEFPAVKTPDDVRHALEEVAADPKTKKPALRRLHVGIPTPSAKTFLSFKIDLSARAEGN